MLFFFFHWNPFAPLRYPFSHTATPPFRLHLDPPPSLNLTWTTFRFQSEIYMVHVSCSTFRASGGICTFLPFLFTFGPLTRVLQGTNFIVNVSSNTYLSNHVMLLSSAKLGVVRATSGRGDIPNRRMEHESLMLCTVAPTYCFSTYYAQWIHCRQDIACTPWLPDRRPACLPVCLPVEREIRQCHGINFPRCFLKEF